MGKFIVKLFAVSLLSLALISPCWATDYTADANCQAAWLMEVNKDPIDDSSQNTNTGAAAGDPTHATASPPKSYSTGYWNFDGVTDRFDVTNNASLDPAGDFSIVAWIKMTSYGDSSYGRIFDNRSGTTTGYTWYVNDVTVSNGMTISISDGSVEADNSDAEVLATGSWIHVAVVKDDTANTATFYVNGVEKGTPANSKTPAASTVDATIGDRDDNTRQFDGDIDELAFFDRTLSQAEILDIYNNGLEGTGADVALFFGVNF